MHMQSTAFGARDPSFFEVILCGAPSSAADAQPVSPQYQTLCYVQTPGIAYFQRAPNIQMAQLPFIH